MANIDKALKTTGKILDLGDYKKWTSLIISFCIVVLFIIILVFVTKKFMANEVQNFWEFITLPFKNLKLKIRAQEKNDGNPVPMTLEDAKEVADSLYGCFHRWYDDEESFYTILRNRINSAGEWELVKGEFGTRRSPKPFNLGELRSLESMIQDNFSSGEIKKVREILISKGVKEINL